MTRFRIILAALLLAGLYLTVPAGAQSYFPQSRSKERFSGSVGGSGMEKMIVPPAKNSETLPTGYKDFADEDLDKLEEQMKARDWKSEDTAWARVCKENTRDAYEAYIARFPFGEHIAEANCRLIDAKIDETLNSAHNDLPNIKHEAPSEPTVTSTVFIENNTGYPLTVYYSGDSNKKSVVIQEGGNCTLTLENGPYKLAAAVPPQHIRPFAGQTQFSGGRYEIGFWVVYR